MRLPLPAAVTKDEAALLGPVLNPPSEYLRALLASSYRQEALLTEIADHLALGVAPATAAPIAEPAPKPRRGKGGP